MDAAEPARGLGLDCAGHRGAIYLGVGPILIGEGVGEIASGLGALGLALLFVWSTERIIGDLPSGALTRHEFEAAVIRFLTAFGYVFFTAIILIPFYVMVMTSLKNQAELMANPLDFSIDLSQGWELLRSYRELLTEFSFRPLPLDVLLRLGADGSDHAGSSRSPAPMRSRGCGSRARR